MRAKVATGLMVSWAELEADYVAADAEAAWLDFVMGAPGAAKLL